jgi:hypothetical protein
MSSDISPEQPRRPSQNITLALDPDRGHETLKHGGVLAFATTATAR